MRKLLFILVLVLPMFSQELKVKPFTSGVTNFYYPDPFWLVSPDSFTLLLTAYSTSTNYTTIIEEKNTVIDRFSSITNRYAWEISLIENDNKRLRKELGNSRAGIVMWTVGGITVGVGFTALIYHLAGSHIKSIQN